MSYLLASIDIDVSLLRPTSFFLLFHSVHYRCLIVFCAVVSHPIIREGCTGKLFQFVPSLVSASWISTADQYDSRPPAS